MEQSPSWEATRFSASQEIPRILCTQKCPPPVPILSHIICPGPRLSVWMFRNKIRFYSEELSASRPTPKLENHPLPAVRDCLFNIFAASFHIGGRSSIRNLRMRHAVVTGTHISWAIIIIIIIIHITILRQICIVSKEVQIKLATNVRLDFCWLL
jgi:hypothetical protein